MTREEIQHAIVSEIKGLSAELGGQTPTQAQWIETTRFTKHACLSAFGPKNTWNSAVIAAGLSPLKGGARSMKISAIELFGRDVREVVESHEPKQFAQPHVTEPILVIGDAHFPWAHQPTLERVYAFAKAHQPKHIVQMGDLYDLYAHSRFPRSQNIYGPDEELSLGREQAQAFWKTLREAAPGAQCYQLIGNHDVRPLKRVLEAAPELETLVRRGLEPYFQFEGVKTLSDYREELEIQGIKFHHGYLSQLGAHRDFNQANIVVAHTHKPGLVYRPIRGRILWEMNVGFVGDETAKVMGYTAQKTTGWGLAFGWIDGFGPRIVL